MNHIRSQKGFTLLEIMLVVVIIAVMAAIVMPALGGRSEQAKKSRAKADVANIGVALGLYELDMGRYPKDLQGLVTNPGDATGQWNGPYLDALPTDPWNQPYRYEGVGKHNLHKYDLNSLGPDGAESDDDVTNWKKG